MVGNRKSETGDPDDVGYRRRESGRYYPFGELARFDNSRIAYGLWRVARCASQNVSGQQFRGRGPVENCGFRIADLTIVSGQGQNDRRTYSLKRNFHVLTVERWNTCQGEKKGHCDHGETAQCKRTKTEKKLTCQRLTRPQKDDPCENDSLQEC